MNDQTYSIAACNDDLLYQQLATGGFPNMTSIQHHPDGTVLVLVHFADDATQENIDAATAIVHAHNANDMSADQQAAQQQQQQVATLDSELTQILQQLHSISTTPAPTDIATLAAQVSTAFAGLETAVAAIQAIIRAQQGAL